MEGQPRGRARDSAREEKPATAQVTTALRKEGLESSSLILGIDFTKSNEWTATTHDQEVFSFHSDHSPCHGFEEVLACYQKIVPNLKLSGPISYAPVIEAAIDIVEKNHGQFHVLVIISDGQLLDGELSPQEVKTIKAIVDARYMHLNACPGFS
ncbi:hypothetical protein RJT34_17869 [Clitoria ternatea]|uniref:Copine C-terminal domain-containing protein n=1 Tax=Clitoria ternatea TaxID=43366 RepID=A0AAN9JA34_CLITE